MARVTVVGWNSQCLYNASIDHASGRWLHYETIGLLELKTMMRSHIEECAEPQLATESRALRSRLERCSTSSKKTQTCLCLSVSSSCSRTTTTGVRSRPTSFLPYTVNFNIDSSSGRRTPANTSPDAAPPRKDSVEVAAHASLFSSATPPEAPSHTDSAEALFPPTNPSSPALLFQKPHDPKALARNDAHVTDWGRGRLFNQPRSRASAPPPATILAYAQAQQDQATPVLQQADGAASPPDLGGEKSFSETGWTVEPAVQGNGGSTNAIRAASDCGELDHVIWVGTLGFPTDALTSTVRNDIIDFMENEFEALTVIVKDSDLDGHYNRYCKTILWDSLNYQIPDHPKSKAYEDHSWVFYVKVNQAFADRVVQSYKHGDTIWVHDYHLLLVPQMIRLLLPEACIGFFLHTSFPSSEVFRCLAMRKQLLEGMLGANLIAFQSPEYANHFLQTCSRLLVVEATGRGVQLDDRLVEVTAVPIGVHPAQFDAARKDPAVQEWIKIISEKYRGKHLIVARDKLDTIRGVKQKLLAYEIFLNRASSAERNKAVLIQVATSTMSKNKDLANAIADIVNRINSKFSTLAHQPLIFLQQDIAFSQYIALLTAADVLMVTPLRDGMNLTCHEYILCQDGDMKNKKHGPLILSEFTGSASLFGDRGGELAVNPWDYAQMARAIERALRMSDAEKERRYNKLRAVVMKHDGVNWILQLRSHLFRAYDAHQLRDTMSVPRLSLVQLSEQYKRSQSRLFILGYEGTLAAYGPVRRSPQSPQRVVNILSDLLLASEGNTVYVSSSNTPSDLEQTFKQVPNLGLIAENGCFVRPHDSLDWVELVNSGKASIAKEHIITILEYYRNRIEGSWIEEKNCGFTFHYESAEDPESAERNAGECAAHISDACMSQRMKAVPVDKGVVVEPLDVSKVTAAQWVMKHVRSSNGMAEESGLADAMSAMRLDMPQLVRRSSRAARGFAQRTDRSRRRSSAAPSPGSFSKSPRGIFNRTAPPTNTSTTPPSSSPEFHPLDDDQKHSTSSVSELSTGEDSESALTSSTPAVDQQPAKLPNFLMVAGDDREDEDVYHWANILGYEGDVENVVSVCIGKRNTEASCTLTQGATGLLTTLEKVARL